MLKSNIKNGYAIITVEVDIDSKVIDEFEIKLKENSQVQNGDTLVGTLVYTYPYIPQIYSTTFNLTVGKPYSASPSEVIKKASEKSQTQNK